MVDYLKERYDKFISKNKLDRKKFENIIYEIINNEEEIRIIKEDYEIKININSPLLEIISKTKNFENNYTIYIPQTENNEEYINIFNQLNKNNTKYASIYYKFKDKSKIYNIMLPICFFI